MGETMKRHQERNCLLCGAAFRPAYNAAGGRLPAYCDRACKRRSNRYAEELRYAELVDAAGDPARARRLRLRAARRLEEWLARRRAAAESPTIAA
jgi:hypothetical protein